MTIKEIAELAGVSISTVSKIVNNKDKNINQETRNRVLKIVKEYNYTPYSRARASAPTKTFLLGVLLRAAPNMDPMLNGILETAQNNGYAIIPLYSGNSSEHELKNISQLCKNRIDGVIWEPVNADSIKNEYHFTRDNIPVTYINSPEPSYGYFIDFVQLGYRMTQKLIDYKHRKIACLLQEKDWRSNLVFQGFEKCLFDNQIRYHDSLKMFDSDPLTISTLLTYDITGVISSHFTAALDLYARLNKMNYYIPSDLSLISLRDDSQDIISFPEISTYRISYQEFGRYVCSELIKTCEKQGSADAPGAFLPVLSLDGEGSIDVPSFLRTKRIIVVGTICADTICNVDQLPLAGRDSYTL